MLRLSEETTKFSKRKKEKLSSLTLLLTKRE